MSDKITKLPGTLTLITDSNVKEMNIALDIPAQVIYLRGYRIQMTDAATALAAKVLYLDIPNIYNMNKMLDNNVGQVYLPIMLDNATVSVWHGMDIPIAMSHHLPERFTMRILDSSFQPVSGLVHASFQFYLEAGRL